MKSEKTVEGIRRNFHIHGISIPAPSNSKAESTETWIETTTDTSKESSKERPKTPTNEKHGLRREGSLVKTPGKERKGRPRNNLAKEGADRDREAEREREAERVAQPEVIEDSREMAMRERDVAMAEVGRSRVTMERLVKEIKGRMVDVGKEDGERQRMLNDKSNFRSAAL